jgi:hypothetical protein
MKELNMEWIEGNEVNWRKLLDDNTPVVVQLTRDGVSDFICGFVVMVSTQSDLIIESSHQGFAHFCRYEVERVSVLK